MLHSSEAAKGTGSAAEWSVIVVRVCGGLSAALGCVVLIGWYTHSLALLRIVPTFVAMAYNTALCFWLCGLGLASALHPSSRPFRTLALLGGVCGASVGLLTLAEYLLGLNLGLDQLLMKAYIRSGITAPGRMAFCTALCFSLVGLSLMLSQGRRFPRRPALTAACGGLVFGLGMVALSGYFVGIIQSYVWGQFTRMAVHTAAGFLILGLGLITLAWRQEKRVGGDEAPRWLPMLVGIGAAAVTLCLWQALVVAESAQVDLIRHLAAQNAPVGSGSLTRAQAQLPLGEMISGLTLSLLLAGAVALAQTARRQASELRATRDSLEQRVEERTEDLARAKQNLEEMGQWQRGFLRDVLANVTDGKLRFCESSENLPAPRATAWRDPISLSPLAGLRDLRCGAMAVADVCGFPDIRIQDLVTAINEAGMNAIVHAGGGSAQIFYEDETVQVWVEDAGQGITMEDLPRAALSRGFTTAGTLGHGLKMMLQTTDRLWLLTGPTGTTVVLEQDRTAPEPLWLR